MNTRPKPPEHKEIIRRLKQSAEKRGIPFDLTTSDLDYIGFPLTCPIMGIPLQWHRGRAENDSFSFDRIDSSLGYTRDNIQIISWIANRAKNDLTDEELKKFGNFFS
jgi:hypothetical protein